MTAVDIEWRGPDWDATLPAPRRIPADTMDAALRGAPKVVILDDDPTGTQTVRDIPVLTEWSVDSIRWALRQDTQGFFVLTNTRSMSRVDATATTREVAEACLAAASMEGIHVTFLSRGDSTLRGHFPLETDELAAVLAEHGTPVEGLILAPAYFDAGRVTLDGVHFIRSELGLMPVAEGEFALDATFGYRSSRLAEWVEEKSDGRIDARAVGEIPLSVIRDTNPAELDTAISALRKGAVVVVDGVEDDDARAFVVSAMAAERSGTTLLYRAGPSLARARLGQDAAAVVADARLEDLMRGSASGGLVVVGSHVGLTGRQLDVLRRQRASVEVELDVNAATDPARRDAHLDEVVEAAADGISKGLVILSTSRRLLVGVDEEDSLDISRRVSTALTEVVARTVGRRRPSYVIAKGGITSSDIATGALQISRAWVRGSMLPGIVSLWEATSGPAAGLPYIVFAGNVGDDESLARVVERLDPA